MAGVCRGAPQLHICCRKTLEREACTWAPCPRCPFRLQSHKGNLVYSKARHKKQLRGLDSKPSKDDTNIAAVMEAIIPIFVLVHKQGWASLLKISSFVNRNKNEKATPLRTLPSPPKGPRFCCSRRPYHLPFMQLPRLRKSPYRSKLLTHWSSKEEEKEETRNLYQKFWKPLYS